MRERIEFEVDEWKYVCTQFGATKATKIWAKVVNKLGPSLGSFIASLSAEGKVLDTELDMGKLGEALRQLTQSFTPDEWIEFVKLMLSETSGAEKKGEYPIRLIPEIYEDHFAGASQKRQLKVVWKVMEINYSDFLGGLSGVFSGIATGLVSNSLKTSTGESGASSSRVQRLSRK